MSLLNRACIESFDEDDVIGGARFDDGVGGDNEVHHTMLEIAWGDFKSVGTKARMYTTRARRKTSSLLNMRKRDVVLICTIQ